MNKILANAEQIKSAEKNVTTATQLLASLPEPQKKPRIAIYRIADKTGKIDEDGSRVLTQGATDMMITALKRSRQFKVLDRTRLGNFMNEQQLKKEDRLAPGEGPTLGKLSGADYIIEGAITEYQIDKKSGGFGLTIAGTGGTKQYAIASTALDIRLVDTTTGEVVWSTSLKDKIKGQKIGLESFSFMGNNIVEFETGRGKQEVINLVVRTIIEEAVFELAQTF
ncbi:MAG: CsgG/HfaB family protein [Halanaerobiales bacterium]|nr:CsgG/HfaB family protein [Halanaerobiales bacterium]